MLIPPSVTQLVSAYQTVHHLRPGYKDGKHYVGSTINRKHRLWEKLYVMFIWFLNDNKIEEEIRGAAAVAVDNNHATKPTNLRKNIKVSTPKLSYIEQQLSVEDNRSKNHNPRRFLVGSTRIHSESGMPYPAAVNPIDITTQLPWAYNNKTTTATPQRYDGPFMSWAVTLDVKCICQMISILYFTNN